MRILLLGLISLGLWGQVQPGRPVLYDSNGNVSVGTPLPATAPPTGSVNVQGNFYQNGTLFTSGAGVFSALSGDATSTATGGVTTVKGANSVIYSTLATGILKNTTGTGVPSIAITNTDYLPVANPSITGSLVSTGTAATDSATLGSELTTSGTCSGTGWTGTYPNYVAPATTAPLTCTGFASGSYYQTVTGVTNNAGVTAATYTSGISATGTGTCLLAFTGGGGSGATGSILVTSNVPGAITITTPGTAYTGTPTGATVTNGTLTCTGPAVLTSTIGGGTVTVAIGTLQTAATTSAASSTLTFGPKANGTSLTYTPTAAFVGTINVSAKLITPISIFALNLKDSGGVSSWKMLQPLSSLNNTFSGGGGTYNTTGSQNSFMGVSAGQANTTGSYNSFMGVSAGQANTTGYYNSFIGVNAGYTNTTGYYNSFVGMNAGQANTTGNYNSFVGASAGQANTTGSYNSFLGANAGRYIADGATSNTTGNSSIYLGYLSKAKTDGDTNESVIGPNATGNGSNTVTLGGPGTTGVYSIGVLNSPGYLSTGTNTVSGCSLTVSAGGATAGKFNSGTTGSCTVTITPGFTAPNGFSCWANDITTPADKLQQLSMRQTAPTIGGTTVSGDVITWGCVAY